jgi:zona occludens toxin (predicted ATPase)
MRSRQSSRGVTLVVVLIFLLLITMFSISAFRASGTNQRITQNMALRQQGAAAAQAAIETVISTPAFQAASAPTPTTINVDVDGDGVNDFAAVATPAATCTRIRPLLNVELPRSTTTGLPAPEWIRCDSGSGGRAVGSGSAGAGLIESNTAAAVVSGASYCVETHWNVQAVVADARSGARVEVNQGVAVPYSVGESQDRCQRNN